MVTKLTKHLAQPVSIIPLAIFRIAFGITMAFAAIRFWAKGWIEELYLNVPFQFHYYGFSWVKIPEAPVLYGLFSILIISALCMAMGLFYRLATVSYFLTFTYIELMDKALYLNHYYFVSLISFLMIFLPAHRYWSLDSKLNPNLRCSEVPKIYPLLIKLQLSAVYFFAGIAKLNSAWLFEAMPLRIWLKARADLPVIGPFVDLEWTPYLISWSGMLYDITIPFLLFWHKSRPWAYATVVIFHIMTWILFQIGVFPWVMIVATLIFFEKDQWTKLFGKSFSENSYKETSTSKVFLWASALFILIQVCLPFRHLLYQGNVTWNEMGFRYSWNVMRVEKTGYVEFTCYDPQTNKSSQVYPKDFLSAIQEKQMAFQPDMILEFAHFLETHYQKDLQVYAYSQVSLNGSASKSLIDQHQDLTKFKDSLWGNYSWVLNE
ncbi:MAG: HTTM domain-containing protein [Lentisphaerales bacterium]|nr:HTTM domain-containing protein [Lentisphaerales bacterium]